MNYKALREIVATMDMATQDAMAYQRMIDVIQNANSVHELIKGFLMNNLGDDVVMDALYNFIDRAKLKGV